MSHGVCGMMCEAPKFPRLNELPVLLNIALHCDINTLFNFMFVSKKCYSVFKHIIKNAPTVFITSYFVETNGILPDKIFYKSLKELFQELHQFKLNNPTYFQHYLTRKICKDFGNLSGPCFDCLSDDDKFQKQGRYDYTTYCGCDDIHYKGIKIVKYISNETNDQKINVINSYNFQSKYCSPRLSPLQENTKGFRISMMLNNIYDDGYPYHKKICTRKTTNDNPINNTNYKSMNYLLFGCKKFSFLFKQGIRKRQLDKMKYCAMYYPGTTDMLQNITFGYLPGDKVDFQKYYHGLQIFESEIWTRRINTI